MLLRSVNKCGPSDAMQDQSRTSAGPVQDLQPARPGYSEVDSTRQIIRSQRPRRRQSPSHHMAAAAAAADAGAGRASNCACADGRPFQRLWIDSLPCASHEWGSAYSAHTEQMRGEEMRGEERRGGLVSHANRGNYIDFNRRASLASCMARHYALCITVGGSASAADSSCTGCTPQAPGHGESIMYQSALGASLSTSLIIFFKILSKRCPANLNLR